MTISSIFSFLIGYIANSLMLAFAIHDFIKKPFLEMGILTRN
jgi:hypothetical protein